MVWGGKVMEERKAGYYWVKVAWSRNWIIAQYDRKFSEQRPWWLPGDDCNRSEAEMREIDERPVTREGR